MELETKQYPHLQRFGVAEITIPAGKSLVIETSPSGVEVLNEEVPTGKVWSVSIVVDIQETDA